LSRGDRAKPRATVSRRPVCIAAGACRPA
jgi:hypothetical protein